MRRARRLLAALIIVAAAACADLFAPPLKMAVLQIVPVLAPEAGSLAGDADQLRVIILRDSSGTFREVKNQVVPIVDGVAQATFTLALLVSPQRFVVRLEAFRSSDNTILYSGVDTLQVTAGSGGGGGGQSVEVPVNYAGPQAASIVILPADTIVSPGGTFQFRAEVRDPSQQLLSVPVRFELLRPADSVTLSVDRLTGVATAASNAEAEAFVVARTLDPQPKKDTARVYAGQRAGSLKLVPGYLDLAIGSSATVVDSIFDVGGNPLGAGGSSWTSRTTAVATVSQAGLVTAAGTGTSVIVANANTVLDSMLVAVPPAGNVVVRTIPNGRSFRRAKVGDTVTVDVVMDMQFTPSEKLGSYNATLTWNQTVLTYLDVQSTSFAAPTVNTGNVANGELRFGSADATGAAGKVLVTRVRFVAAAQGATTTTIAMSEMSAAQTFTNLISRVTVVNGHVTVSP